MSEIILDYTIANVYKIRRQSLKLDNLLQESEAEITELQSDSASTLPWVLNVIVS
jgi:hypothetical protein